MTNMEVAVLSGTAFQPLLLPAGTSFARIAVNSGPAQIDAVRLATPPPDGWKLYLLPDIPAADPLAAYKEWLQHIERFSVPPPDRALFVVGGNMTEEERQFHEKAQKERQERYAKGEEPAENLKRPENWPWGFPATMDERGPGCIFRDANIELMDPAEWLVYGPFGLTWLASCQSWLWTL